MGTRILVVALVWVGAGCSQPPPGACGSIVCGANQRCTSSQACVIDDPPVLTVEAPLTGAAVSTSSVTVKGTAKDDDLPPTVEVSLDESTWTRATLGTDGAFTLQLMLPNLDAAAATVVIRATDSKGQLAKESRALQVDNVPPSCAITSPANGAILNAGTTVTMVAADGSQTLLDPRLSTDGAITFTAVASFSSAWTVASENGVEHDLVFRVDDGSGHTCEARALVMIDNVRPSVAFASPDAGSLLGPKFFTAGGVVRGTADDGTRALQQVTLDFDDGAGPRMAMVQSGGWSISVPAPIGDDFKPHLVTVLAADLAGNTASAVQMLTVDVKPPVVAITFPAANAKLGAASFPAGDALTLNWTVTDGDPQLPTVGLALPDGGVQSPVQVTTAPTDNPTAYQATVVATDRAGNSGTASVSFSVDRVAPTVTAVSPANNTRMHVGPTSIDFSEPMQAAPALLLTPALAGTWTTTQHYEVGGLAKDSVYTVAPGAVSDLHGNAVAAIAPRKFHTETWVPASGATLATGYSGVTEAVADPEGALNLAATRQDGGSAWVQLNPASGAPEVVQDFNPNLFQTNPRNLGSWRTAAPDLSSRRIAGLTYDIFANPNLMVRLDGGSPVTVAGNAFIPTPAFVGEGAGLAEFGVISGTTYQRGGRPDIALGFSPEVFRFSAKHWEISKANFGGADSQTFGCHHQFTDICDLSSVVTTPGTISSSDTLAAISSSCSVHHFTDFLSSITNFSKWQPGCQPNCAADSSALATLSQIVGDPSADGVFFGLSPIAPFQIQKVTLDGSCAGSWSNVGTPITLANLGGAPRLVVIRGNPGLVYADTSGNVKFAGP